MWTTVDASASRQTLYALLPGLPLRETDTPILLHEPSVSVSVSTTHIRLADDSHSLLSNRSSESHDPPYSEDDA